MSPARGGNGPHGAPDRYSPEEGGGGRAGRFFARVFESPDNPLGWSVRIFTLAGIAVRVHLFTILFIVFMLLWSIPRGHAGVGFMAAAMSMLFLLVLAHEFGHCFACRWVGGSADRIVMLPIGGLALVRPPDRWRAHLIATVGGPAVNAAFIPVTVLLLWGAGLGSHIIFNPLDPMATLTATEFGSSSSAVAWAKYALWWAHYANIILLGFNVLVPAYPLDGGRIVQALLWARHGYTRATETTVVIGFASAMVLGVLGLVVNSALLVVVAFLAGWSCWTERRRLRGEDELGSAGYTLGAALPPSADEPLDPWTERRRAKRLARERQEQQDLDRVLAKITSAGKESLSRRERALLRRMTEKKRRGG